jgi:hypothetical protein
MARSGMTPQRLAGDTAYSTGRLLKWLVDRGATPHVPVWDRSARVDGKFLKADFTFDRERNVYMRPAGKELTHSGVNDQGASSRTGRAGVTACAAISSHAARRPQPERFLATLMKMSNWRLRHPDAHRREWCTNSVCSATTDRATSPEICKLARRFRHGARARCAQSSADPGQDRALASDA